MKVKTITFSAEELSVLKETLEHPNLAVSFGKAEVAGSIYKKVKEADESLTKDKGQES